MRCIVFDLKRYGNKRNYNKHGTKSANCSRVYTTSINTKPFKSLEREKLLKAFSSNCKIKWKSYEISCIWSRATAMRGKAISSGEKKIILNVFKHFETENSSLKGNAVTFKVWRIVKHGVIWPSKIRPNRKKEFNKMDQFKLGVVRHTG